MGNSPNEQSSVHSLYVEREVAKYRNGWVWTYWSIKWFVNRAEGARWKPKDVDGLMEVDTVDPSVKISFSHVNVTSESICSIRGTKHSSRQMA